MHVLGGKKFVLARYTFFKLDSGNLFEWRCGKSNRGLRLKAVPRTLKGLDR